MTTLIAKRFDKKKSKTFFKIIQWKNRESNNNIQQFMINNNNIQPSIKKIK